MRGLSRAEVRSTSVRAPVAELLEEPQPGGVADRPTEVAQLGAGVGGAAVAERRVQDHGAVDLVDHDEDGRDLPGRTSTTSSSTCGP